ncbi:MAG: hypothetical protein M0P58_11830 [Bacteroidales bacterium]|nr:hypothetical protein [Bacteroidales bacterium]
MKQFIFTSMLFLFLFPLMGKSQDFTTEKEFKTYLGKKSSLVNPSDNTAVKAFAIEGIYSISFISLSQTLYESGQQSKPMVTSAFDARMVVYQKGDVFYGFLSSPDEDDYRIYSLNCFDFIFTREKPKSQQFSVSLQCGNIQYKGEGHGGDSLKIECSRRETIRYPIKVTGFRITGAKVFPVSRISK